MNSFTEDNLVQKTMADYLVDTHGWRVVMAWDHEDFGSDSLLGRSSDHDVVLTRDLMAALKRLNPDLPDKAYDLALKDITSVFSSQSLIRINQDKHDLLISGVKVKYRRENGEQKIERLRVFDFDDPENNDFLAVRELWVRGPAHRRRADMVGFVNGLPLMFCELKRPDKDLRRAYDENLSDYKDTIPHLFHFNALVVLGNGETARVGSISAEYGHFAEWLTDGDTIKRGNLLSMEALLAIVFDKCRFMDVFENYILFADTANGPSKILAKNQQLVGVNRAVEAVDNRSKWNGRLGVFWHTQGSGKSFSMAFLVRKVHRKLGGDYTFLIVTDRRDLDRQIYKTFASVDLANTDQDPCRASSAKELRDLLGQQKKVVFTMIQKFTDIEAESGIYSERDNIIVVTDEAHRTQYGELAFNMRKALPNASFIGFTGTPLFANDEVTKQVFGEYLSTYDFQHAIDDGATLPLYYDARGDKLNVSNDGLNEKLADAIAEAEFHGRDVEAKLQDDLKREYHVVTAQTRLQNVAQDFTQHYSTQWESGKAMFVVIDKITAVRMYNYIQKAWAERLVSLEDEVKSTSDDQEKWALEQKLAWMRETEMAVVVSDEQNEVKKFKDWDLDIIPHRKRMKDGFTVTEIVGGRKVTTRLDVETAFKRDDHPFRIVIVCAMWLTGFDVPALSTLYLDKPLNAHTLMQAIARANRVKEGKNNGLVVDYCGILKNLRQALATFAGHTGDEPLAEGDGIEVDPLNPEDTLLAELNQALTIVSEQLRDDGFDLEILHIAEGFEKIDLLKQAKEIINANDETRKRFEIGARAVFRKYKACLTFESVEQYKPSYQAIHYIYQSLQDDKKKADTSTIIQKLNQIVSDAIDVTPDHDSERIFDISKINFDLLRTEFAKSERPASDVQDLRSLLEVRLARMLAMNPTLIDFQERFNQIVSEYNQEKDKNTIEATFEALMRLTVDMDRADRAHVMLGLTAEQKPIFDLLIQQHEDLDKYDIEKIKKTSIELLRAIENRIRFVQDLFQKEATRDALKSRIYDVLYADKTGLPADKFDDAAVEMKTKLIFDHFEAKCRAQAA